MESQACEPKRRVARAALARPVLEIDLDDARTGGEDERLGEFLLPDHAEHGCERVAGVGVESATEVGDLRARKATQHSVDEP